jgi:hypothetical protein
MKNLKSSIAGLAALLIGTTALAQGTNTSSTNSTNPTKTSKSPSIGQPLSSTQPASSIKTKVAAPKEDEAGWGFSMGNAFAFKRDEASNAYQSLMALSYQFTPMISVQLATMLTGPLSSSSKAEHTFADPELEVDYDIPLMAKADPTQFNLNFGTGIVMPTSLESYKNSMLIGGSLGAGFTFKSGGWSIVNINQVYGFSYRQSLPEPDAGATTTAATDATSSDTKSSLDSLFDDTETSAAATAPESPMYVYTLNRMFIARSFLKKAAVKGDVWYETTTPNENVTDRSLKFIFSLSYGFTPNIRASIGVSTSKALTKKDAPEFYTEKSTAGVIGLGLKI